MSLVYFEAFLKYISQFYLPCILYRFLDAYAKEGLRLWGITAQNEPTDGNIANFTFQAMGWTAQTQRDFIKKDLGPALHEAGYKDIKLMVLDDQRLLLPYWADIVSIA